VSSQAAISTASCSDLTGLLAKNSLLRCDSVSDDRVTGEGSLAIVEISEEGVYVGMVVVVAAAVVAAVVVVAVVVAAAGVQSRLVAAVVLVKEALKSMASSSTAAMSLIDVNGMSVVGYGWNGDIGRSRQCAEGDEWYRRWLSFLRNVVGGGALYIPGGVLSARSFFV